MAHETYKYMAEMDGEGSLGGVVEADEIYVGGKHSSGKRGRGTPNKTVVDGNAAPTKTHGSWERPPNQSDNLFRDEHATPIPGLRHCSAR